MVISMGKQLLAESTSVPVATSDGRWKATLITPGKGSSGTYSETMLRENASVGFRKGAKCFVTHNRLENGEPDPFAMWGFLTEDAAYEDGVGVVGEIEVLPSWRDKVAEVAPHTALSVYVMGEADEEGNVTHFVEDKQNGVDLVVYPGREGSGLVEKLYESLKTSAEKLVELGTSTDAADDERKKREVEEKLEKLVALFEAMSGKFDTLQESVTKLETLTESATAAETDKVDAIALADEVSTAVTEAKLPKEARKRVFEAIGEGVDVADAVKAETAYIKSITESLEGTPEGRVHESDASTKSVSTLGIFGGGK